MEIETLPQIMLACQVPEVLEIMIDGHEGCTVTINTEKFTLFPEIENEVYLRGFRELVRSFITYYRATSIEMQIEDIETGVREQVTFTVYACDVEMDAEDADAIMKGNRFLTCGNEKRTYATADEYLYIQKRGSATITSRWIVDGELVTGKQTVKGAGYGNDCYQYTVSPSIVTCPKAGETKRLLSYTVTAGSAKFSYIMVHDNAFAPTSFKFYNAFRLIETLHFFGDRTDETKVERESGAFYTSYLRNYKRVQTKSTQVYSGYMLRGELPLLEDLLVAESPTVTCVLTGDKSTGVLITDHELKNSESGKDALVASITYRASYINPRRHPSSKASRTFADQFDDSFN